MVFVRERDRTPAAGSQSRNPLLETATDSEAGTPVPAQTVADHTTTTAQQLANLLAELAGKSQLDPEQVRALIRAELATQPARRLEVHVGEHVHVQEGIYHKQYPSMLRLIAANCGNIMLSGPAGSGKTTAVEKAAEALSRQLFIVPPIGDKYEVIGFVGATGNYVESAVYRWAKAPPGSILLLDEVDGSMAQALLALNVPLANGIACFPHEQIQIPREHIAIANGNTWGGGASADYCGRSKLGAAFLSRFPNRLPWDYDEAFERAISGHPDRARFIQGVRNNARMSGVKLIITPRDTQAYCKKRAAGFSHLEACETSFLAQLTKDVQDKLTAGLEVPA